MKGISKVGLLLAVALVACAAVAASAQAVVINPPGTTITGIADDPILNYGEQTVTCDSGFATGTTTDPASDTVDVDIDFDEPCDLQPVNLSATTDCNDGNFTRLRVSDAITNDGLVVELLPGFQCRVVVAGVCTLTVNPQKVIIINNSDADLINEGSNGSEAIDMDVDVVVNNNNALCGPVPSGTGGLAGLYELDTAVRFDP
jgi:hypothetical protein